jgi:ribosomal protein L12E/L44/L45/RPP1/RPP2
MIKTVMATVVAAAFLISIPARAEDKAPAPDKAEKSKKDKKEKKEEPKKEEKAGGGW